jgi:hypothetical protein
MLIIIINIFSRFLLVTRIMNMEDSSSFVMPEDQEILEEEDFEEDQMEEEEEAATIASSSTHIGKPSRSVAWDHYEKQMDDKGVFGKCMYCG